MIVPRADNPSNPVFAGYHRLNGAGEMTGTAWIEESGLLTTPIGITNTHSVGVVRDALIQWDVSRTGTVTGSCRGGCRWWRKPAISP